MKRHLIIGCGYTGLSLAKLTLQGGQAVTGTSTGLLRRAEIEDTGAHFATLDLDDTPLKLPLSSVDAVTVLAPPPDSLEAGARRIRRLVEVANGASVVVVVSTALYGDSRGTVTERTRPAASTLRGKRWEIADATALLMRRCGHDVKVVRTPSIYGPGRDFRKKLEDGSAVIIDGAPTVSRIHRDDLARLLWRMHQDDAPPILLACDDLPAPTFRASDEAARLLSLDRAPRISIEEAKQKFSERGFDMRMGGHICKSVVRPLLGVSLTFPTYREGLRASFRDGI
ncbi:MAG: hypothetical protein GY822_24455 [Deltaproteobacteria bacterium]|nr:hypothetical protein [Deltaproteobacteria bacterium]